MESLTNQYPLTPDEMYDPYTERKKFVEQALAYPKIQQFSLQDMEEAWDAGREDLSDCYGRPEHCWDFKSWFKHAYGSN